MQSRKNITRNFVLISFIVVSLLLLSGCWDRRDLDERGIVSGVAVDKAEQSSGIVYTVQVIDPAQVSTGKTNPGDSKPFFLLSAEGTTIFYAVRHLAQSSARKLFYDHNNVILFGEELARQGIDKYLDFFMRNEEIRKNNWLMVAEGKGADVLKAETPLVPTSAQYLGKLVEEQAASNSESLGIRFVKFSQQVMSQSTAPLAPLVRTGDMGNEAQLRVSGMAVFNRELRMVGKLNGPESRGLMWVLGKVKSGIILIQPGTCEDFYSLEIIRASSRIMPAMENGNPQITVKIAVRSNLGEAGCTDDLLKPAIWNTMEKQQAQAVRREIMLALEQARQLNADIFGFGDAFYKKYPAEWKQLGPKWQEIFPALKVNVVVESKVERPGATVKTVMADKGR